MIGCASLAIMAALVPPPAQDPQTVVAPVAGPPRHSLSDPTPDAGLRELSTDRPDKTESPYTVDAGRFQIETDLVTYTIDRPDGFRSETLTVAPINLKAGLTNRVDLQVVFDAYVRQTVTDRSTNFETTASGVGDVTVRVKANLWGDDGGDTALAVMPFLKLPTNTDGLGNDAVEGGIIIPLAIRLTDRVGLGLMTEIDVLEDADGDGHSPSFINSATLAFGLTDRLGMYTELYTERSAQDGADWIATIDVGFTYGVTANLQLDAGVNLGVTEAADDIQLFVGVSRRF